MNSQLQINDGGPAFPKTGSYHDNTADQEFDSRNADGMTLRDWFAGQALVGIMSNNDLVVALLSGANEIHPIPTSGQVFAANAYQAADAMIAARNQPNK